MKKKLILIMAIVGLSFSTSFGRVCSECEPCFGSYYFCESDWEDVWDDVNNNCGPGTNISLEFLEGC